MYLVIILSLQGDFGFHNIHSNGRFVLVSEIDMMDIFMYDLEELLNESIENQDLWSRRMSFSNKSKIIAVSNKTKFAVSYRKKLTLYDVWKDRDYEECPDESEYTPLEMEVGHVMHVMPPDYIPDLVETSASDTDSDDGDEYDPHDDMSSPSSIESDSDNEQNMNE